MSTNVKPLQGRHRAPVETRTTLPSAPLRLLFGGAAVVLIALVGVWQVL
ncbi:hypothetical protein SAMN04487968_11463 [Nocardioides terrae]|uniref:Uncharacterized protein n=1 Tax=Nocardioides terrae TaxID=574651 RepID=A0A1I1NAW6_9ACTN|nr:hypothetical protein [Nocardioides terrae]SFC91913.1 hypothetical protein SAMN04487968_11463 [Nocardioides terrae]